VTSELRNNPADVPYRAAGPGSMVTRSCMGCHKAKLTTGGTGVGIRWRCAGCSGRRLFRGAPPQQPAAR
jgi:hypothetical protein